MLYDRRWDKPEIVTEPWRKFLLDAADIIEQRGHCHGTVEDEQGRVCLAGALSLAAYGRIQRTGRYNMRSRWAADIAWSKVEKRYGAPVIWNDNRTGPEVVRAIRAIALAPE